MLRTVLCFVMASACSWATEVAAGVHLNQPAGGPLSSTTYHLYIPTAYVEQPTERCALLLMYRSRLQQDAASFQEWAERRGVVVVAMAPLDNHDPRIAHPLITAVLADVMAKYRIETGLRFSYDTSVFLTHYVVTEVTQGWGGWVQCGQSLAEKPPQSTGCIGWVPGPAAEHNLFHSSLAWDLEQMNAWSNPCRMLPPVETAHWNPTPDALRALDWMISWQRLTAPGLSPEMRTAQSTRVRDQIKEVLADPDPASQMEGATSLLLAQPVAKLPEAKALPGTWASASLAVALGIEDAQQRARALTTLSTHAWSKTLTAAQRKHLTTTLSELRKDPDIKADGESRAALAVAERQAEDYHRGRMKGADQKNLRTVIKTFEGIVTQWPGTAAAKAAAATITRLEKSLR